MSIDTVRYYERRELLPAAPRTAGGYRGHRKILPLVLGIPSTAAVLYTLNTDMNVKLLYAGLAGLIAVSIWNSIEAKRCVDPCEPSESDS